MLSTISLLVLILSLDSSIVYDGKELSAAFESCFQIGGCGLFQSGTREGLAFPPSLLLIHGQSKLFPYVIMLRVTSVYTAQQVSHSRVRREKSPDHGER